MTTDLEKHFFSTFGIEPKKGCTAYDKLEEHEADTICNDECLECLYFDDRYPQITDRILLELISFIGKKGFGFLYCENTFSTGFGNRKDLITVQAENFKEGILTLAIQKKTVLRIKKDVQALFKE